MSAQGEASAAPADAFRTYWTLTGTDYDGDVDCSFRLTDSQGRGFPRIVLEIGGLYISLAPAVALALSVALDAAIESARDVES